MDRRGFSLVELLIVVSLMAMLTGIGTYQFASHSRKANISAQTRKLHGTLTEYRMKAFYEKRNWTFKISANGYDIYSSSNVDAAPVAKVKLAHPVASSDTVNVEFNGQGVAKVLSAKAVCVDSTNDSTVDSVVVSATRVLIGKKTEGSCQSVNIQAQ